MRKSPNPIQSERDYQRLYRQSIWSPVKFWSKVAKESLDWKKPWRKVYEGTFAKAENKWFFGGKLNLCENALDRHLDTHGNKAALIWEGDSPAESRTFTYRQLHREVCRYTALLRRQGVKKGDRVTIYLPMIPELVISVLACARLGAIHCVVFGGFSAEAIKDRILDSKSHWVITADGGYRAGNLVPLKANMDAALAHCPGVKKVFVVRRTGQPVSIMAGRDLWIDENLEENPELKFTAASVMDSEDPLFILYTSGSTGKPKGVLHTSGGYGVYTAFTTRVVFDLQPNDVYFCTADIGWVTGHSYLVYGPLFNAATCVMFEGVPTYPDASRFWRIIDRYGVSIFYTSPTALRSLMRLGDGPVKLANLGSLRLLGTVGEPINPEAWRWYHKVIGKSRCPIVDTWWQTETGGILITALPYEKKQKPGAATKPFFGIQPVLVNEEGKELKNPRNGAVSGHLCLKAPWPGIMRTVYGDKKRFFQTYFSTYKGYYFTGDGSTRDKDGDYWITGRVDDVLNVSGHRIGTAEIESALVLHANVAEAAVVGYPHDIKGQGIYCYVTLKEGVEPSPDLKESLRAQVAREISAIAKPDVIQWATGLPKTRSGKIMRRILRKIAHHEFDQLGDTSTLADASVVQALIDGRKSV